jgi:hypothetical protein
MGPRRGERRTADVLAAAGLVVTELVTNAARHARTMAVLRVSLRHHRMLIEVGDGSKAPPVLPDPSVIAAHRGHPGMSRGLLLVEAIADRWGYRQVDGGKVVWARLNVHGTSGAGSAATAVAPSCGPVIGCRTGSRWVCRGAGGGRRRPGAARRRSGRCC